MDVFVDEPVSQVRMDDGEFGYLIQVFLIINKEDWEQNQCPPGISENSENLPSQNRFRQGLESKLLGIIHPYTPT